MTALPLNNVNNIDLYSINGNGYGATVRVDNSDTYIINKGADYKLSDILIGHVNDTIYIFRATNLTNVFMKADVTPINWNMPIHTQIYRFFFPNSYDVGQIRATKDMFEEHGLEYVVQLYVSNILNLPREVFTN